MSIADGSRICPIIVDEETKRLYVVLNKDKVKAAAYITSSYAKMLLIWF